MNNRGSVKAFGSYKFFGSYDWSSGAWDLAKQKRRCRDIIGGGSGGRGVAQIGDEAVSVPLGTSRRGFAGNKLMTNTEACSIENDLTWHAYWYSATDNVSYHCTMLIR